MEYFYIPGYYHQFKEITMLLEYMKKHPEQVREDRCIAGSYDLPQGLLWNGGRAFYDESYNPLKINVLQIPF